MTALEWVRERFMLLWEDPEGFEVVDPQTGCGHFIPREDAKKAAQDA